MMACAIEMAEKMAQMSPVAIQGTKTSLNYSRDHSVEEGLEQIVRTTSNFVEANLVFSFL